MALLERQSDYQFSQAPVLSFTQCFVLEGNPGAAWSEELRLCRLPYAWDERGQLPTVGFTANSSQKGIPC